MKTQSTTTAKAPRRSSKDEARDAFIDRIGSARELLTLIRRHIDDYMGEAPEDVTWANVGDAAHTVDELKNIARFLNLIGEEE